MEEKHDVYPNVDYIVVESTYGDRIREEQYKDEKKRIDCLTDIIVEVVLKKKGKLIVPVFSLDRSQSIMFAMYKVFLELNKPIHRKYTSE